MEKEIGMPAGEKTKEEWYDVDVICSYCKKKIRTDRDNNPKLKNVPNHGICADCLEDNFPEDSEESNE